MILRQNVEMREMWSTRSNSSIVLSATGILSVCVFERIDDNNTTTNCSFYFPF